MNSLSELYRNLFQYSPQSMWIYDTETLMFEDVNETAIKYYGYSRAEFMKMNLRQIRPAEDLPTFEIALRESSRNSEGFVVTRTRHIKKNGELINVELKRNCYESNGKTYEFVIIYDITEQLKTEEAFRESQDELIRGEKRYRALVQGGSDLTAIINSDGIYQFVSESCFPLLGIKPQNLIGKIAFDYVHPEDRERVMLAIAKLKKKKRVEIAPFRFLDGNKQWRWISTAATNLLDDPEIAGIVTNSKDITEMININNELHLSNERYKLVLKAADEAIFDWDIENDVVIWGLGFKEIFGYDISNYNNTLWSDNIHPDDREWVLEELETTLKNPEANIYYSEYRFRKANGEMANIQYRGIFLRDESGKAIRAVGAFRDITAEKKRQKEIQIQNAKLQEIAWTQSHKIRDSLTRVIGLVNLLMEEQPQTESQRQLLQYLSISTSDLDQGIREIVKKAESF